MALQTFKAGFECPGMVPTVSGTPGFRAMSISAAGDKIAFVVQAPKTGTIDQVGWRTGTVTTGATMDVRLETVSATTGDPTGTLFGTNTNGSQVVAGSDDDHWFDTSLTSGASVTKGDLLAIVIVNPGSPGNLEIVGTMLIDGNFPYCDRFVSAAWTKQPGSPVLALRYNDSSYEPLFTWPISAIGEYDIDSSTTPDEVSLRFQLPFPVQVTGFWAVIDFDNNATAKLYDSDGSTVLASVTVDKDVRQTGSSAQHRVHFAAAVSLLANTYYRLSIVPPDASAQVRVFYVLTSSAALLDGLPCGQKFTISYRTDAGSWSDATNTRPLIGLIIDGFSAGGGLLVNPGMAGGMNG